METAAIARSFRSDLLELLVEGTILLAGLYFLLLPPTVAQGRAFRWFGAFLIGRASLVLIQFYIDYGPLAVSVGMWSSVGWLVIYFWQLAWIEFGYAFFRRPVSKTARCLELVLLAFAMEAFVPLSLTFRILKGFASLGAVVAALVVAGKESRKRTPGATLALIVFALYGDVCALAVADLFFGARIPTEFNIAGFRVWQLDVATLLFIPIIAMQIHKMNQRFRDEQTRLHSEMEAARHIQELLVPAQRAQVPGFLVEASYEPAAEVGGDFFNSSPYHKMAFWWL